MCSDSEKNMSAYADQNHASSLTCVRLEWRRNQTYINGEMQSPICMNVEGNGQ